MNPQMYIVYSSPAGSTRHVAAVIEKTLQSLHAHVDSLDLKNRKAWSDFQNRIAMSDKQACLFTGTPVYRGLAVPPVMSFISGLRYNHRQYAVPFATWGGSSSGNALWQMGTALKEKGFEIVGATKVMGMHSIMFGDADPLGKERPNAQDDVIVERMVADICQRLANNSLTFLPLELLDYQPEAISSRKKREMRQPWKVTSRTIDEAKCTQCQVCKEECPVDAIVMTAYPQFGTSCIDCLNCVRLCPKKAIIVTGENLSARSEQIKARAKVRNEQPQTQAFVK